MLDEGYQDLQSVPILVISAMAAPLTKGDHGGVRACFSKPIDIDTLLNAVRTHAAPAQGREDDRLPPTLVKDVRHPHG